MTNGALSTHEKTKRYRDKRLAAGYSRVTVWFPPEIDKLLENYAFNEVMLSKSATVEEIVADFLKGEK